MITHYIPIWAKMNKDRALAVCKRYVDYASDSDQPTCEDCRRLIAEEETVYVIEGTGTAISRNGSLIPAPYLPVKRP